MPRGASVDGALTTLTGCGDAVVLRHMRRNVDGAQMGHMVSRVIGLIFAHCDAVAGLLGFGLEHDLRSAALGSAVGEGNRPCRRLIAFGFVAHLLGILLTACAGGFWTLYAGTLSIGIANGTVEAALNPLTATLYPDRKTERLNALHVSFPGGIVLGGLMSLALTSLGYGWRVKTGFLLVPVFIYGLMFRRLRLPPTERVQSSTPDSRHVPRGL